jgi:hypothetical protein
MTKDDKGRRAPAGARAPITFFEIYCRPNRRAETRWIAGFSKREMSEAYVASALARYPHWQLHIVEQERR